MPPVSGTHSLHGSGEDAALAAGTPLIQHHKWLEQPLARQMSGDYWKKGTLNIAW